MFPLLASKPHSFKIPLIQRNSSLKTRLKPLAISIKLTQPEISAILVIYDTQLLILNSETMDPLQEIILDFPIKAFHYKDSDLFLHLQISEGDNEDNICTFTGKDCSHSIDISPDDKIFKVSLKPSNFSVEKCSKVFNFPANLEPPFLEFVEGGLSAKLNQSNYLEITPESDKNHLLSSVKCVLDEGFEAVALLWIEKDIFVLSFSASPLDTLRILKFGFIQIVSPSNGFLSPLITWNHDLIHVHRSSGISPSWFTLQGPEVWDVLYSPVGIVRDIQVSSDGNCLLISGIEGIAICDFLKRSWENITFPILDHIKWIGNSHIIAVTPNQPCLIIISREIRKQEIFMVPIEDAQNITHIDTYNNWQILIQKSTRMEIYKFDPETLGITLFKSYTINPEPVKQAACLQDALFVLFKNGQLVMIKDDEEAGSGTVVCEAADSFVVLPTGHFLIRKTYNNQSILWKRDLQPQILAYNPLAVLPFTDCMTLLSLNPDCRHFSIVNPIQSKFLLPKLFASTPEIIFNWIDDPLFPTALEFTLLDGLKDSNIFKILNQISKDNLQLQSIISSCVASISRKIEVDEAINSLVPHFSPISVLDNLRPSEKVNFLSFLAKAFDSTGKEEFSAAIKMALNGLFSQRKNFPLISRIQEYLEAFNQSQILFKECLINKIRSLWSSGRVFKAFELIQETGIDIEENLFIDSEDETFMRCMALDEKISSVNSETFHSWLNEHKSLTNIEA